MPCPPCTRHLLQRADTLLQRGFGGGGAFPQGCQLPATDSSEQHTHASKSGGGGKTAARGGDNHIHHTRKLRAAIGKRHVSGRVHADSELRGAATGRGQSAAFTRASTWRTSCEVHNALLALQQLEPQLPDVSVTLLLLLPSCSALRVGNLQLASRGEERTRQRQGHHCGARPVGRGRCEALREPAHPAQGHHRPHHAGNRPSRRHNVHSPSTTH
jgi:hypothetical protein